MRLHRGRYSVQLLHEFFDCKSNEQILIYILYIFRVLYYMKLALSRRCNFFEEKQIETNEQITRYRT